VVEGFAGAGGLVAQLRMGRRSDAVLEGVDADEAGVGVFGADGVGGGEGGADEDGLEGAAVADAEGGEPGVLAGGEGEEGELVDGDVPAGRVVTRDAPAREGTGEGGEALREVGLEEVESVGKAVVEEAGDVGQTGALGGVDEGGEGVEVVEVAAPVAVAEIPTEGFADDAQAGGASALVVLA